MKIYIVYDSESGHTEALAKSIAEGAKGVPQAEIYIDHVKNANPEDMAEMDALAHAKAWLHKSQASRYQSQFKLIYFKTGLISRILTVNPRSPEELLSFFILITCLASGVHTGSW